MSYRSPSQDNDKRSLFRNENKDTEGQSRPSKRKKIAESFSKTKLGQLFLRWYDEILVFFRTLAVSLDPLFFYIPVIKEDKKCIGLNKVLWNTAIVSRSVIDVVFLVHFVVKFKILPAKREKGLRLLWSIMFKVLVTLPIPQVVMPSIFSEMRRTKSSNITILNSVILLQYGLRVYHIYQHWKKLIRREESKVNASQWFKASWNLFLYILAGHVLGAFWYFFSTQRLAACWHKACEIHGVEISFNCDHSFRNLSFLDDFCPIDTPNPSTFDFGIFLQARQSGSLESTNYLPKAFYCFWWGMRNLSSFGSNLQTSSYMWENIFALGISIFGLLLFLYCIGNLQLEIMKDSWLAREEQLLHKICDTLKPTFYNEHCYIVREGDPIDAVFFITDGIVWTSTSNNGEGSSSQRVERLERGQYFGEELLEWVLKPTSGRDLSILPVSSKTLKTHTKVEAYALMAHDFNKIWQFSLLGPEQLDQAAILLQRFWRSKRLPSQQGCCWGFKKTCFDV
ncbi:hypothetical protein ACB092_07G031700 [Castanea dentata]